MKDEIIKKIEKKAIIVLKQGLGRNPSKNELKSFILGFSSGIEYGKIVK